MHIDHLNIAVDGGAATGKSTVSKIFAERLELTYVNSGLVYRFYTYYAIKHSLLNNLDKLVSEVEHLNISYEKIVKTFEHDINQSSEKDKLIMEITNNVSHIASSAHVRASVNKTLRHFMSTHKGIVMEGRDIGTVVMHDADFKFFLIVSDEEAARRRHKELLKINPHSKVTYEEVLHNVKERNRIDSTRQADPLKAASDANIISTDNKTVEQIVNEMIHIVRINEI